VDRVKLVRGRHEHVEALAANMEEADIQEIAAFTGETPHEALTRGVDKSTACITVLAKDGTVLAMFGIAPINHITRTGIPWLLATKESRKYRREFILLQADYIEAMLDIYPRLLNYVHASHKVSVRWLKRIGFTLEEAAPAGVKGELFHKFHLERADNV